MVDSSDSALEKNKLKRTQQKRSTDRTYYFSKQQLNATAYVTVSVSLTFFCTLISKFYLNCEPKKLKNQDSLTNAVELSYNWQALNLNEQGEEIFNFLSINKY